MKTNHFTEIWNELKNRLDCKKEDCWLKEIRDTKLRKEIDEMIFAPDQPPEWKNNPDEWLSNFDIIDVLKQYQKTYKHFNFIEPTPIDFDDKPPDMYGSCVTKELCKFELSHYIKKKITKIGIIFNLDKHDESGSHWVSLFIDLDDKYILYFDSAADIIQPEIEELVDRILKQGSQLGMDLKYEKDNTPFEHQMGNTECGMYSLYFIITLLTGKTGEGKQLKGYVEKRIILIVVAYQTNMYLNVVIYILIVVVKNNKKYNIFLFSQVILYLSIKMVETTKKMEIMTNIYPYEKSKDKITIGDVTIDVMNNFYHHFTK